MPKRSKTEENELVAQLRSLVASGATDWECLKELGVTADTLTRLKQKLFADLLEPIQAETAAETWVRYMLKLEASIDDLDDIIAVTKPMRRDPRDRDPDDIEYNVFNIPAASALNAGVGAIKAKVDLINQIHTRGQELGVIPRVATGGDDDTKSLEIPGLRKLIASKEANIEAMVAKYGTADMGSLPAATDDELYFEGFEEEAPEPAPEPVPVERG